MAEITAALVKQLRDATNVSMMECKRSLVESGGDLDAATTLLRERGIAVAAKRASRTANQGLIASHTTEDGKTVSLVEVNCETDFVARNDTFKAFVAELAAKACETDEALGKTLADQITAKVVEIGENIVLRRNVRFIREQSGAIGFYIHMGGKVGVLVELGCTKDATAAADAFQEVLKDLTLHVAACNPSCLTSDEVPADQVAAERDIYAKQVADKPANVIEKIVDGKLRKFFEEICLVEQGFVKEPKQAIKALLAEKGKELDDEICIRRFARYQLGV